MHASQGRSRLAEGPAGTMAARDRRRRWSVNQIGSLLAPFFTPTAVTTFVDAKGSDVGKYARYFQGMLERGSALAPAQFEAMFISAAHTQEHLEQTLFAAREVLMLL